MEKNKAILKSLSMFFIYFVITMYGGQVLLDLGVKSDILRLFIKDLLFMIIILIAYFDNLKSDYIDLKKAYKPLKFIKNIFLWVMVIIIAQILLFALLNNDIDSTSLSIIELSNKSMLYVIFKTMIFAVIAEKILFVESIRSFINNKWLFIITGALIFTLMNFLFIPNIAEIPVIDLILPAIGYFIPTIILLIVYVQNNSNIIMLMAIIFTYSFIPFLANFI